MNAPDSHQVTHKATVCLIEGFRIGDGVLDPQDHHAGCARR
ncbi:hypothetical protein [Streptomyces chartreusis]